MIYSTQEASSNKTEQRDFMLAIKALLQDQKDAKGDEHGDRTKEIPRETSRHKISNNTIRNPGSDADRSDPPATLGINSQNQASLDPHVVELKPQLQGPESSAPIFAVQSPKSPPGTTKDRKDSPSEHGPDRVRPRGRGVRPELPEPKLRMGIHLFLLKPVVENYFDKVELTWLLQNFQMRESAIQRYLDYKGYQERVNVLDMFHMLHPYEKKILDGVIFGIDMRTEGSLLSLTRTKTTICHRDITFTDVPGLQFVVRRERQIPDAVPQSFPEPPVSFHGPVSFHEPVSFLERPRHRPEFRRAYDVRSPIREERAREWKPMYADQSSQDDVAEDEVEQPSTRLSGHRSRVAIEDRVRYEPARRRATVSSSSEDDGWDGDQELVSLPEQDENTAIDDMLKRYTTLFD